MDSNDERSLRKSQFKGRTYVGVASTWRVKDQKDERSQDGKEVTMMGLTLIQGLDPDLGTFKKM